MPVSNGFSVSRGTKLILLLTISAGVLARLWDINQPLAGFRNIDTAAVARNFCEGSMRILYPQVDWRGNSPGYVESEFQAYTFLVALLYKVFGVHEWFGSALSVLAYAVSAVLLFQLCRRLYSERVSLLAVGFYSVAPLSLKWNRTFMPDTLMTLGALAGVYWFWIWTEDGHYKFLILSAAGLNLAVLIKPFALYLGFPLLYLAWRKFGRTALKKPSLWVYSIVIVIPSALWYYHAWWLWKTYGNTFGIFGGWVKVGIPGFTDRLWLSLAKLLLLRLVSEIATPAGVLLLLVGFFAKPPRGSYILHWWVAGFFISCIVAARGYQVHNYYLLLVLFPTAALMAYGAAIIWQKEIVSRKVTQAVVIVVCLFVVGFSLYQAHEMGRPDPRGYRVAFGERVKSLTEPDALIVFVIPYRGMPALYQHRTAYGEYLECDPMDFYYSHRKGWSLDENQASPEFIDTLRRRGAKYFATAYPKILERRPDLKVTLDRSYTAIDITPKWIVYRLDKLSSHRK